MEGQNTATSDLLPAVHQVGEGWLEAGDGEMQKNVSWVLWEGYHQNKVPCLGYNMKITSYDICCMAGSVASLAHEELIHLVLNWFSSFQAGHHHIIFLLTPN